MTNPLSKREQAACKEAFMDLPVYNSTDFQAGFSAALDYLRAELAKEEPDGYVTAYGDLASYSDRQFKPGDQLYLRPSEPSKEVSEVWALANKSVVLLFATKADADIFQKANRMDTPSLYLMPQRMPVLKCDEPSTSKEKGQ